MKGPSLYKKPNPTTKAVKKKVDEKEEQVIENMSNQETTSEIIGHEMHLKNLKKKKKGAPNMKTGKYKHNF